MLDQKHIYWYTIDKNKWSDGVVIMTFDDVRQFALSLPAVEEHLSFGQPTLKVGKRFLTCIAQIDADSLCVKVTHMLEIDFLVETNPDVYYAPPHYANFQSVLIRLSQANPEEVYHLIEKAWRAFAPKRVVAEWDKSHPSST